MTIDNLLPESSPKSAPLRPRALRTVAAARYLGVSPALLRKWRLRAPGDPGEHGPPCVRITPTLTLYPVAALDAWLDERTLRTGRLPGESCATARRRPADRCE